MNSFKNQRVGVLLGGKSNERPISILSGEAVYRGLKRERVDVVKIDIGSRPVKALKEANIDFAFIALHGKGGEDGTIQKLLERLGIPYTGSSVRGSYNAFNKIRTKTILRKNGIPVPKYEVITARSWEQKIRRFHFPVILKPVADGSSIGVYCVDTLGQLKKRLKTIFSDHPCYILEQYICGREITIGIVGDKALPIIELRTRSRFYDYAAKYTKGKTNYLIPASFPKVRYRYYQRLARATHYALGAEDFSRVDMIIDEKGDPFVLELNSIPGFTKTSLLPKAANETGMSFEKLCLKILHLARRRCLNGKKKKKQK